MNDPLSRMIELTRGRANAAHVLTASGEFTAAELIEYLPQVLADGEQDPIRSGALS